MLNNIKRLFFFLSKQINAIIITSIYVALIFRLGITFSRYVLQLGDCASSLILLLNVIWNTKIFNLSFIT